MSLYSQLFLRDTNSPYGDVNRNSTLSFKDLDQNFLFLKERDINQLRVVGSDLIYETLGGTEYSVNIGGASSNTFVTGFTFNSPSTYNLTIEQNGGESPLTVDLSSLASDVYVISGSYNPSTGDVEFTNSTGGTFVVSGFTTGMTDTYVTGGTLTGTNLVLEKSNGVDTSAIDLSSLSGSTPNLQQVLDEGSTATDLSTLVQISTSNQLDFTTISGATFAYLRGDKTSGWDMQWSDGSKEAILELNTSNAYISYNGGGGAQSIFIDPTAMTVTDAINTKGLEYAADYSSNFTNESLVTKRYVDNSVSGKVETALFNTYTGDTATTLAGKLDTTTFNTYSGDVQTQIDSKTDNTDFTSHTGDTTIHYTKGSINLSDLGSSAHTHPISEVVNLQTELDGKTNNTDFISHTGDTTIHFTKSSINLSDLGNTAHTHTLSEITDFNSYSGNTQNQLDSKIEDGINSGGANEVFSGKSGTDLYFRTISGGTNTTVTTVGDIIKIDSTGGGSGEINTASNIGGGEGLFSGKSGVDLQFKSLTSTGGTVTINSTGSTVNLESSGGGSSPITLDTNENLFGGTDAGTALSALDARNTLLGYRAGRNMTTGKYNVFIGERTASDGTVTGNANVSIGSNVMKTVSSGSYNMSIGSEAGKGLTTQSYNTLLGFHAGDGLTGSNNVAITNSYGGSNMADRNVVIGQGDATKTIGSYNVILGKAHSSVSDGNIMIGYSIQQNGTLTGDYNIFLHPNSAGLKNYNAVSGDYNIAIGIDANIPTGKSNFISINDHITIDQDAELGGINVGGTGTLGAMWHIKGAGTTSATSSLLVQNSSGTDLFEVIDEGSVKIECQVHSPIQTLTDAINISTDFSNGNNATVVLTDNRTLANPTNLKDGASYVFIVKQDAIGSRTLSYGTAFKFPGGIAPTLSTGSNAVDILTFICDGTNLYSLGVVADVK